MLFALAASAQQSNTPYDYPVKPGSEKWNAFKTVEDMYAACQVPEDVLSRLTTPALIQTCMRYPATLSLFRYNTPQMSFERWKQNFNGIRELLSRRDAPARLLEYYKTVDMKGYRTLKTDTEKGEARFRRMIIESIIAQDEIVGNLQPAQKRQLLNKTLANLDASAADDAYGFFHQSSIGRIIVKLAAALGDNATRSITSSKAMQDFMATGTVADRETFSQVIEKARGIAGM